MDLALVAPAGLPTSPGCRRCNRSALAVRTTPLLPGETAASRHRVGSAGCAADLSHFEQTWRILLSAAPPVRPPWVPAKAHSPPSSPRTGPGARAASGRRQTHSPDACLQHAPASASCHPAGARRESDGPGRATHSAFDPQTRRYAAPPSDEPHSLPATVSSELLTSAPELSSTFGLGCGFRLPTRRSRRNVSPASTS